MRKDIEENNNENVEKKEIDNSRVDNRNHEEELEEEIKDNEKQLQNLEQENEVNNEEFKVFKKTMYKTVISPSIYRIVALLILYRYLFKLTSLSVGVRLISNNLVIIAVILMLIMTMGGIINIITVLFAIRKIKKSENFKNREKVINLLREAVNNVKNKEKMIFRQRISYIIASFIVISVFYDALYREYIWIPIIAFAFIVSILEIIELKKLKNRKTKHIAISFGVIIAILLSSYLGILYVRNNISKLDTLEGTIDLEVFVDKELSDSKYWGSRYSYNNGILGTYYSEDIFGRGARIFYEVFESKQDYLVKYYSEKAIEEGVLYTDNQLVEYEKIESNLPNDITVYEGIYAPGQEITNIGVFTDITNYILVRDDKFIEMEIRSSGTEKTEEIMEEVYEQLFRQRN